MEQLSKLLQGLQSSARAQAVLKTLLVVLDDVLSHPELESCRRVRRDEITPVGARLLESCGFCEEPGAGELRLPAETDLQKLREAREDVALLLRKAVLAGESAAAAAAPPPAAPASGPLAAAPSAAMALQLAAMSVSPSAAKLPPLLASTAPDDVLGAADPSMLKPKGRPGDSKDATSRTSRTVPASVTSAAAAVGQAVGAGAGLAGVVGSLGGAGLASPSNLEPAPAQQRAGGSSRWIAAPPNVLPESRLVVALPEAEFTYIERPWSHFVARWAAIDVELARHFGESPFAMLDLGSCCGFFSLQAAAGYPLSLVVGIEGSVGIGNGSTGVSGTEDQIIATKAVQTHLRWIDKLQLPNGLLAPEVWDYRRVCQLSALGRPICDAMLSLSVVHHIDNISTQQYAAAGLSHLEGTLSLMAKLLDLAPRHFIELPDRPWIEHVHSAYGTAKAFLEAAVRASGRPWNFVGPLVISEWYGTRDLWLLEDAGQPRPTLPTQGLKALFPRVLGFSSPSAAQQDLAAEAPRAAGGPAFQPQEQEVPWMAAPEPPRPVQLPFPQQAALKGAVGSPMTAEELGAALLSAPTALIAAHVQLRDALAAAEGMMSCAHSLK